ncbi:hypothetical protein [Hymenobacter sp. B81]|uniref:hypothetical protein n=1 Tax=Hymenobacter sp. B81 TaxID=3344878 RepID=UPI0037DCBEFE
MPTSPVHVTQVIDARAHSGTVGWVMKGLDNTLVRADVAGGAGPGLAALLYKHLHAAAGSPKAVLRLTQLQITEQLYSASEAAMAEVGLELWLEQPNGYVFWGQATATHRSTALDVTSEHAGNIVRALDKSLRQLLSQPRPDPLPAAQPLAVLQRPVRSEAGQEFPIQRDTVLRAGVYRDYLQFRNNAPEMLANLTLKSELATHDEEMVTARLQLVDDNGKRVPIKNVWGFSDGQRAYVYFQYNYFALTPTAHGFRFRGPHLLTSHEATERAGLAVGLGMVGGLRSAAQTARTAMYEVSLLTGQVIKYGTQAPSLASTPVANQATSLVLYCRGAAIEPAAAVKLNGQIRPEMLGATRLLVIPYEDYPAGETEVCVGPGPGSCLRLTLDRATANYVEVRFDNPAAPTLRRVPASLGEVHVRKLSVGE